MPAERPDAHSGSSESPVTPVNFGVAGEKRRLRNQMRRARRTANADDRRTRDAARNRHLLSLIPRGAVVAIYLSRPGEPSTTTAAALLWRRGHRVLAPALRTGAEEGTRLAPAWAWYTGPSALREGLHGIPEPIGPALPATVLGEADVVVISALAAGRDGSRLGGGGGWYDQALQHARPDAEILLLVDDSEVSDSLPQEPHDRPVKGIVTETGLHSVLTRTLGIL